LCWVKFQELSRTPQTKFKDFQGPDLFSGTFQTLKIKEKFQDYQGLSRINTKPAITTFLANC